MVKRIDSLTEAQKARFDEWADRWIEAGLRTGAADRPKFEAAAERCYRAAGLRWHGNVVWVPSPIVVAIAAPVAALMIELHRRPGVAVRDAVSGAVGGAVDDAVSGAVGGAVSGAVDDAHLRRAVAEVISRGWVKYIGGQLWASGWWWGGAHTSYFREVCGLELDGDLWERGLAYEATIEAACWWYPHRDFILVGERATEIHREHTNQFNRRGFGSHRLHRNDGPAVAWPDGWGVYSIHGVQIPFQKRYVVERPELITIDEIHGETNAEVRRIMVERYGHERYLRESHADLLDSCHADHAIVGTRTAKLWRIGDITMLDLLNSTPEPDGSTKRYVIPVDGDRYDGRAGRECIAASASTWRKRGDPTQLVFERPEDYSPSFES